MPYYIVSICLSAFLLFLVEPLVGKVLLPWFGGTPSVWSAVMLFFQALLTGGYAYAAWLSRDTHRRGRLHLILLGLSLLLLLVLGLVWKSPLSPSTALRPGGGLPPVVAIFLLLSMMTGLPFFLLASNSSLVQAWFGRSFPGQSPYRLYALSNLSALLALLSYPLLVEPNLALPGQGWLWSAGYLLFAGLAAHTSRRALRLPPDKTELPEEIFPPDRLDTKFESSVPKKLHARLPLDMGGAPSWLISSSWRPLLWLALSACPSILFLATSAYLSQQVAVIPFLWVLPLAIYLLSFVLTFSGGHWYSRQMFILLLLPALLAYDLALANGARLGIPWQVTIFSLLLFIACMLMHGELYRLRPDPQRLPGFYLTVSAGGALGGILVALVAPLLFKGFWELPLGVLLFSLLLLAVGRSTRPQGLKAEILARISFAVLGIGILISGVRAFLFIGSDLSGAIRSERNFYGVVRVRQLGTPGSSDYTFQLIHGDTVHGSQFQSPAGRRLPTVYYGLHSGVGLALLNHPRPATGLRVGALGLGIGTIAAYGQPGDIYRFYEINPLVIHLAQGQGNYFSYLKDSQAKIEIVPGDARLSLERELASGQLPAFDVLVLDVFSNDAIPVHLLDEQAFALYLHCLGPEGVLAVHITNGYLDLVPVVWGLADHFNLARAVIEDPGDGHLTSTSTWVLLATDPAQLSLPAINGRAKPMAAYSTSIRLWTDEYSNLFQLLKH